MITIEFEISKNGYTLKDAIVLPDDHTMNDYLIDAIKQQRFDDWYAIVTAPSEEELVEEPTDEVNE
jgi:hypothetical protein